MNFEAIIGLEIHIELKTKSKMFSSAPNVYGQLPNSATTLLDFAFPGTLPLVNKQAVKFAIQFANALHMDIDRTLIFDRKNYFYSDLPKGYQITQNEHPIGKDGYLNIETSKGEKKIKIERIHLEEDTCKQLHFENFTLLDYNRAGVPLIEVVSLPDFRSGEEAMKYVEKIRSIVQFLGISDGRMEEGSMRVDTNVSIRPFGSKEFGTKVEVKNLNSIANIKAAIDFEVARQVDLVLTGGQVAQETRRFDEASKETVLMRVKTEAMDYKYFVEPNIAPIKLSEEFISEAISSSYELAESKLLRYSKLGLSTYDAGLLVSSRDTSIYFDKALEVGCSPKLLANWINVEIQAILNKEEITINEFNITAVNMGKLVKMIDEGKISNKQAREVFAQMLKEDKDPNSLAQELGLSMNSDSSVLLELARQVLDAFPQSIIDYKAGKERALGFLVGQMMKASKGKANPSLASEIIKAEIKER